MKNVLVLGASLHPERYSHMAMKKLKSNNFSVFGLGHKKGYVDGMEINTIKFPIDDLYAVSLYLNPANQEGYYDYVIDLRPGKVIFNPGTENNYFESLLDQNGIEHERACTLVLLSINQF